jgi:hypothetical protein
MKQVTSTITIAYSSIVAPNLTAPVLPPQHRALSVPVYVEALAS